MTLQELDAATPSGIRVLAVRHGTKNTTLPDTGIRAGDSLVVDADGRDTGPFQELVTGRRPQGAYP